MYIHAYWNTSEGNLTWHNEILPEDEVWIKIGGDKGGGTFKLNVQLANTKNPNSRLNTNIIAVFQANDSRSNLWTALEQYQEQITEIEGMEWR